MRLACLIAVALAASPALAREDLLHVVSGHYGFTSDYPQSVEFMLWPARSLVATFESGDDVVGVTQRVELSPDNPLNNQSSEKLAFAWSVIGEGLIATDNSLRNWQAGTLPTTVHFDYVFSTSYPVEVERFTAVTFSLYGIFDRTDHYESSFFVRVYGELVPEPASAMLIAISAVFAIPLMRLRFGRPNLALAGGALRR